MPKFGSNSRNELATCHPKIQKVLNEAIKFVDFSVLEGHRGKQSQNDLFDQGRTKVLFPKGRHNSNPSRAVDIMVYPIDWKDYERMTLFAGYILGTSDQMGVKMIWGNDWDRDFQTKDTNFKDYPHFELHKSEE